MDNLTNNITKKLGATNMSTGNPYKLIVAFSIPLLLGNILQQLYNMVDSIVVGQYIGAGALAAVGTGFPIMFMINSIFIGIGIGATIMISQFFGASDYENLSKTINTIMTAMQIVIIPISLFGFFICKPLLILMKVPVDDGTLDYAVSYMRIIFVGTIGIFGYNINYGILQGLGDSKSSLIFLAIASVVNIILDIFFTAVCGFGVIGVAVATVIGELISWILGIFYINKKYKYIHLSMFKFYMNKKLMVKAIKLGIPMAIQQAMFSIGIMVMQSLVNSFGTNFMAGFNGANKIDSFVFMPINSLTTAVSTYVGHNIGAKKIDRVRQGTRAGMVLSIGISVVICLIIYPLSSFLMRMFSNNQEVIQSGVYYLHCVLPFYFLFATLFILSAVLKGAGAMIIPTISSIIALWIVRVPSAYAIAYLFGKKYIFLSYAVGWLVGIIIQGVYYKTGKWKNKRIEIKTSVEDQEDTPITGKDDNTVVLNNTMCQSINNDESSNTTLNNDIEKGDNHV